MLADLDKRLNGNEGKLRHRTGQVALRPPRGERCRPGRRKIPLGDPRQLLAKSAQGRLDDAISALPVQVEALKQGNGQFVRPDDPAKRTHRGLLALPQTIAEKETRQRIFIHGLGGVTRQVGQGDVHAR